MNKTTIQVEKITLEKLKEIKLTNRESYNEIILRLINATNTKN
jgi:predicted CopG family antitoxin